MAFGYWKNILVAACLFAVTAQTKELVRPHYRGASRSASGRIQISFSPLTSPDGSLKARSEVDVSQWLADQKPLLGTAGNWGRHSAGSSEIDNAIRELLALLKPLREVIYKNGSATVRHSLYQYGLKDVKLYPLFEGGRLQKLFVDFHDPSPPGTKQFQIEIDAAGMLRLKKPSVN